MKLPALVALAARAALDKKAEDVVALDLRADSNFTDVFLLCTGQNQRQLVAICDAIQAVLRAEGYRPDHLEGYPRQEWVLMDYGDVVIHLMTPKARELYDLERLWGGAGRKAFAER